MTMTVGELIVHLQRFDPAMKVMALWDTVPGFVVHRVELFQGRVLLDCGDGPSGDWDVVKGQANDPPAWADERIR